MKSKTEKLILCTVIFTLLCIGSGYAQDSQREKREPPTVEALLEKMDENEDGKLSKKEVKGPLKEMFSEIDTDEDGFLSKEELEKAPKPKGRKPERQ